MRAIIRDVFLLLLGLSGLAGSYAQPTEYYLIRVRGVATGYIKTQITTGPGGQTRTSETFLKTQVDSKKLDYRVREKTLLNHGRVQSYTFEKIWQERLLGQWHYLFGDGSVKIVEMRSDKNSNAEMPLRPGVIPITDYFSLIPLLNQCSGHPLTLYVIDVKQIDTAANTAPAQKLRITPQGDELVGDSNARQLAGLFLLRWGKSLLKIVLAKKTNLILQLSDLQGQMDISLTDNATITQWLEKPQAVFLPKIRPFPFASGHRYYYSLEYKGKNIGKLAFKVATGKNNCWHINARARITARHRPYAFTSETVYDSQLRPLSYSLKEGKDTEIVCQFILHGVKTRFSRKNRIVERFVPLSPDFVFLDNNAIHHFAVFVSQIPFAVGKKLSLSIFHPRRLQGTKATLEIMRQNKLYYVLQLRTPYHQITMWIDHHGKLVRYRQGELLVALVKEKTGP